MRFIDQTEEWDKLLPASLLAALERISTFNTIDELLDAFTEAEEAMREMGT